MSELVRGLGSTVEVTVDEGKDLISCRLERPWTVSDIADSLIQQLRNQPTKQKRRFKMFGRNKEFNLTKEEMWRVTVEQGNRISKLENNIEDLESKIKTLESRDDAILRKVYAKELKSIEINVNKFRLIDGTLRKSFKFNSITVSRTSFYGGTVYGCNCGGNDEISSTKIAKDMFNYIDEYQKYKKETKKK